MPATFDSVLIHSRDPERLRDWYVSVAGGTPEGDALVHFGDVYLAIAPHDDIAGSPGEPDRVMVNLAVDDLRAESDRLDAAGVTWIRPVSVTPFGLISTVADPDGNYIQLVQKLPTTERAASPA